MSVTIKQEGVERSTVNVGTVGHVDHGKKVLIVGADSGIIARKLGIALVHAFAGDMGPPVPRLPEPKPAKRLAAADLERIEAAEAKRQRRIERNQKRSS